MLSGCSGRNGDGECLKRRFYEDGNKLDGIHAESNCKYARFVSLPLGDIILCKKMSGRKLPYKIPFIQDKEVCIATRFNLKLDGHIIGGSKIDISKINNCLNKETYEKGDELLEIFSELIDYKEGFYIKK